MDLNHPPKISPVNFSHILSTTGITNKWRTMETNDTLAFSTPAEPVFRIAYYNGKTFTKKPTKKEYQEMTECFIHDSFTAVEVGCLINDGYAICTSTLSGNHRHSDYWNDSSIIGLDFDDGKITIDDFKKRCVEFCIDYWSFIYTTFRHTPEHPRFRAIFFLDKPISDKQAYKKLLLRISSIFPSVDKGASKDIVRQWNPGSVVDEFRKCTMNVEEVMEKIPDVELVPAFARKKSKKFHWWFEHCPFGTGGLVLRTAPSKHLPTTLEVISDSGALRQCTLNADEKMTDTVLDHNHENNGSKRECNSNTIGFSFGAPFCFIGALLSKQSMINKHFSNIMKSLTQEEKSLQKKHRSSSTRKASTGNTNSLTRPLIEIKGQTRHKLLKYGVRILNDFFELQHLKYSTLWGIATNLKQVKGGLTLMKKIMEDANKQNPHHPYKDEDFDIIATVKNDARTEHRWQPMLFKNFSPYPEDHKYHTIDDVFEERGKVRKVYEYDTRERMTIGDAFASFCKNLSNCQSKDAGSLSILNFPVGIGKTEGFLESNPIGQVLAVPTHQLKNDIYTRARMKGIPVITTPKLEGCTPLFKRQRETLLQNGLYKELNYLNSKILRDKHNVNYRPLKKYKEAKELCNDVKDKLLITTHESAILELYDFPDTITFDEDPINTIFSTKSLDVIDVQKLFQCDPLFYDKTLQKKINDFFASIEYNSNGYARITPLLLEDDEIDVISQSLNNLGRVLPLFDIFKSTAVYNQRYDERVIKKSNALCHFYNVRTLPPNKNNIILSATPRRRIYEKLYPSVYIIDGMNVEMKSNIKQDTSLTWSHEYTLQNIDKIKELTGSVNVISFQDIAEAIENGVKDMYFFNTSGYDGLKGKDLFIIGTPKKPNFLYSLMGYELGIDSSENEVQFTKCEYKGLEKTFYHIMENEYLRMIQCEDIEAELLQAIGRARPYGESCIINVLSGFPLVISNYLNN